MYKLKSMLTTDKSKRGTLLSSYTALRSQGFYIV